MRIKFDEPIIGKDNVLEIDSKDLDDFYVSASDTDRMNLFFILLTSLHYYEENGDTVRAAHLSFLAAYYVFTPLTPPGSHYLALHYLNKAISLNRLVIDGGALQNSESYRITYVNGTLNIVERFYTVTVTDGTGGGEYAGGTP